MNALPPSCGGDNGGVPTRLISCDTPQTMAFIGALKKTEKASYAEIVLTDSRYGGSGGEYPVITTGSPAAMAIHELMHRLGFADEYGYYNACEADIYCPAGANDDIISPSGYGALPTTAFNIAAFQSLPSYPSSAAVLSSHANLIPWASDIEARTALTTNGKLGSPTKVATGIYRAIVCDLATTKMETWQSTSSPTIMKTLATTYIPEAYWHVIAKSLGTTISK